MDKETIKDSENTNSDEWKFLLLMMLMEYGSIPRTAFVDTCSCADFARHLRKG